MPLAPNFRQVHHDIGEKRQKKRREERRAGLEGEARRWSGRGDREEEGGRSGRVGFRL